MSGALADGEACGGLVRKASTSSPPSPVNVNRDVRATGLRAASRASFNDVTRFAAVEPGGWTNSSVGPSSEVIANASNPLFDKDHAWTLPCCPAGGATASAAPPAAGTR